MVSLLMANSETVGAQEPPPDDYTMNDIWESGSYGRVSVGSPGEGSIEKSGDRDFFAGEWSETVSATTDGTVSAHNAPDNICDRPQAVQERDSRRTRQDAPEL